MRNQDSNKHDWIEIGTKVLTPIIAGVLIAWAGYVSNFTLTDISNRQESARLITQLQIQREQAESELRKDVFAQTLESFLLKAKDSTQMNSLEGASKQMLRLELLSLNFGDSLSLSPLFKEFRRDLSKIERKAGEEPASKTKKESASNTITDELRNRLYSLARRVASTQASSLEAHGVSKSIDIPLYQLKNVKKEDYCETTLYRNGFSWPQREVLRSFGIRYSDYQSEDAKNEIQKKLREMYPSNDEGQNEEELTFENAYIKAMHDVMEINFEGITRYLDVMVKNIDPCTKSANVTVLIYKDAPKDTGDTGDTGDIKPVNYVTLDSLSNAVIDGLEIEAERSFQLDYFNFPVVDNTRLRNNQRFSIILSDFDTGDDKKDSRPHMELTGLLFPSEYASLRDKTGMEEARKLLESALKSGEGEKKSIIWYITSLFR